MSLDPADAAEALASVRASRRRLAMSQAHWPWSRHAGFAVLLGGVAAVQALPIPFNVATELGMALAAGGVAAADRRRRGVFVNGWRRGRTLWVTLTMVLLATGVGLFSLWLSHRGFVWAPVAFGVGLIPIGIAASKLWEHVYRRELQESL